MSRLRWIRRVRRAASDARARRLPRRTGRGALIATITIATGLIAASAATAGMLEDRLDATRSQSKQVKREMSVVDRRQDNVVKQISDLNAQIATLDGPLHQLEDEISGLDARISHRQDRIVQLQADYEEQAAEITELNTELGTARQLLSDRVVAAYVQGETGMIEQLAGAGNLRDLFDREEALGQVVGLDQKVIDRISETERSVRVKRAANHATSDKIRDDIKSLADDRSEIDAKRAKLQGQRNQVAAVKSKRDAMLTALNGRERQLNAHLDDLEGDAKVLQEVIRTGQSTYAGSVSGVSPSGLIYPVSGAFIASPFGWRWGRMHEGVDLAVPAGTPIHAAAAGVVTYASWMSGYGNMVIVQHAGGLSTGYGHQSKIASHVGEPVSQGQVIGFVGCTGHCFGDHVHFETRENGTAVDPMKYL